MNGADRLELDMRAQVQTHRIALVIVVCVSTFVMALLVLAILAATGDVSHSVTAPEPAAAPNWNAATPPAGGSRP